MDEIIPIPANYRERYSGAQTLNFLLKNSQAYVMDNHLAAGWCWMQELVADQAYCFYHIDQHSDLCDGGPLDRYVHLRDNPHLNLEEYTGLEYEDDLGAHKVIRWDTYIKQLQHLFPNWFSKSKFACSDVTPNPEQIEGFTLNATKNISPFYIHDNVDHWIRNEETESILNLDLDYFFDSEGMRIFSDDYILKLATNINNAMDRIAVLTIALSPECCGGWENAVEVYNIVADRIDLLDANIF